MDLALVEAFSGGSVVCDCDWQDADQRQRVLERIDYHGVSGLLMAHRQVSEEWPSALVAELRERARGQAMWELRHRALLTRLLSAFASLGIVAILLKGTAMAYDLYEEPATRSRGDTDVLVAPADVSRARAVLKEQGFVSSMTESLLSEELRLQEVWTGRTDGEHEHSIDLHWAVLNCPTLAGLFTEAECRAAARPLPRLCATALALDWPRMLIHACVHRQLHVAAPYFVQDRGYFGGDRLIWFRDIFLLANSLSEQQWSELAALAEQKGVSEICSESLALAYECHGTALPRQAGVLQALAGRTWAGTYLKGSQSKRALMDLRSVPGLSRKLAYLTAQALPSADFIRAKYPRMRHLPVPLLYARRFVELLLPRPGHGRG